MYEDQTLLDAGLTQGTKLIIEPGPVPLKTQVESVAYFCVHENEREEGGKESIAREKGREKGDKREREIDCVKGSYTFSCHSSV